MYVMPDPAGLGPTLDRALAALPEARSVAICGGRIGTIGQTRAWSANLGEWNPTGREYVTRDVLDVRAERFGHEVRARRVSQWFGDVRPAAAAEAMRIVRGVTVKMGTRPGGGHPSNTGAAMLARHWERTGQHYPTCPPEVAELLTSTSGQGRFEVMPAAAADGVYPQVVRVDARFQYAAIAGCELPIGEPVEVVGELPDPYAPSWSEVRWTPADGLPFGLLPVLFPGDAETGRRKGWQWPTSGEHVGWVSGAELHLARQHGYRVEVVRSIVWPGKGKPLRAWSKLLADQRARVGELPVDPETRAAARAALRNILMLTIGAMHRYDPPQPVITGNRNDWPTEQSPTAAVAGSGSRMSRPEWSTAIYGVARARLAAAMLDQRAPVLGCTLDGFYVGGEPVLPADDGRVGRFRVEARGQWPEPVRTVPEMFAASKLLAEVGE